MRVSSTTSPADLGPAFELRKAELNLPQTKDAAAVLDQRRGTVEPHSSSAWHAVGSEIREAYELWSLEYTDDDRWVCVDSDCGAQMIPCCWKWSDERKSFLTKAGEPAKMPPYFRSEGGHGPSCDASLDVEPRDHTPPEYRLGVPSDYPGRVKLYRELPGNGRPTPRDLENVPQPENPNRRRARSTYSIREACEYYADHSDQHWRRLRIDDCPGSTYQQCFVRLGTGKHKNVGKNWIFFDQCNSAWKIGSSATSVQVIAMGSARSHIA